jgi:hypothetical protein
LDDDEKESFEFNIKILKLEQAKLIEEYDGESAAASSLQYQKQSSPPLTAAASSSVNASKQVTPMDKFSAIKINKRQAAKVEVSMPRKKSKTALDGALRDEELPPHQPHDNNKACGEDHGDKNTVTASRVPWTKDDDEKLLKAIERKMTYGNIGLKIFKGSRTAHAVASRYYKVSDCLCLCYWSGGSDDVSPHTY